MALLAERPWTWPRRGNWPPPCALLTDPARRRLGALARRHCLGLFSRDRVVEQVLGYYRFVRDHDRAARPAPPTALPPAPLLSR